MKIPPYLASDLQKPILNKVEVQHSVRDLFLIWAEWSTTDSILLKLRRIDEANGWDQSFQVYFYSVSDPDDFESISIHASNSMDYQMEYFPKIIKIFPYHTPNTPIMNPLKIHTHPYQDKFQIWTDYQSIHSCTIHVRRKDARCGWGQQLKLRIFQMDGTYGEDILIGPSLRPELKYEFKSNVVELQPYQTSQSQPIIPLKIYQTHRHNEFQNSYHESAFLSITKLNPEYEYYYFNDESARQWIINHYDERVLTCYDLLLPNAYKADFFRICILYKWGGCYFDHKHILRLPLRQFFNDHSTLPCVYCYDLNPTMVHNGIIFAAPLLSHMGNFLQSMIDFVEHRWIPHHDLAITGPYAIAPYVPEYSKILSFTDKHMSPFDFRIKIISTNDDLVFRSYRGYYTEHRLEDYGSMFLKKQIYYENYQYGNYKGMDCIFMTYPELGPSNETIDIEPILNTYKLKSTREKFIEAEKKRVDQTRRLHPCSFSIQYEDPDSLSIRRTDECTGWEINLCVIVILDHVYHRVPIGPSHSPEKIIPWTPLLRDRS